MTDSLRPGLIFAGCRLEAVAGRGGMGVVFRATQLALQRPVALKAIAPDLAADREYRERFQRESHLAASIDHPNVIPVYEAGELDGLLYLIMRWVEGTDLSTRLTVSGRLSPASAITLLRPVALALAAAHRRGRVQPDVKPAKDLIARGDGEDEDHVYLTDFGIARLTDGETMTRTGMLVGTVDYMAPEMIEGGKGGPATDIYSLGCMLFEVLTGRVPFARPTDIAKMFAHINDPIPSTRGEGDGGLEQLDPIIAKAMAKRPEDRFESAAELAVALGQALREHESAERDAAAPKPGPEDITKVRLAETAPTRAVTQPTPPRAPDPPDLDEPPVATSKPRRSPILWVAPIVLLAAVGVLVATLNAGGNHPRKVGGTSASTVGSATGDIQIHGSGMREGHTVTLASPPGSIAVGPRNVWVSLPARDAFVRLNPITGVRAMFAAAGSPNAIAAGLRAVWVAETASRSLAQFDHGAQVAAARLPGNPGAVALDRRESSAWVADSSGAISHVALGGSVIGTPAHINPAATSIDWGEGWLWAVNGSDTGLVRVSLDTSGSSTAYPVGPDPVAVTLDKGVWTAHANGQVSRFDPRPGYLRVNADVAVAPELDGIAATDPSPFVWAISKSTMTLYRITNTSDPSVTGRVVFGSPPVALAVDAHSVWVAMQDGTVTQIRF